MNKMHFIPVVVLVLAEIFIGDNVDADRRIADGCRVTGKIEGHGDDFGWVFGQRHDALMIIC